jgi:SAM-dependent methyltransferase
MKIRISTRTLRSARVAIARAATSKNAPTQTSKNWRAVWIRKGTESTLETLTLGDFFKLNGWDTGAGQLDEGKWRHLIEYFRTKLRIREGDSLLEVGCGAGLFLLPFAQAGVRVSGIDYSTTLIEIAKAVLPRHARVLHSEADHIPFADESFEQAASNGVFLYFPHWHYAERALDEILRVMKPGGRCLITDIADLAKKKEAERARRENLGQRKYREMYKGLSHLYYDRSRFECYARDRRLAFEIIDQKKANSYGNSAWRFMFYFEKPQVAKTGA